MRSERRLHKLPGMEARGGNPTPQKKSHSCESQSVATDRHTMNMHTSRRKESGV